MSSLIAKLGVLTLVADPTPKDNDVIAGWGAFVVFVLLALAVALLGWSLSKQLRKAQKAADEGKFDPSDKAPRNLTIAPPSSAE